ncbi:MAG TPA: hypothetical protein VJJ82_03295 [Candidatus Nanoarchaeia archaeon]|nr:hypothetical protein [Candidatus Nanoarchaeia archaeon]
MLDRKLIFLSISVVALLIISAVLMNFKDCKLGSPLACNSPRLGTDGFLIKIANVGDEPIYFLDLIVIQKGTGWCNFHRYVAPEEADLILPNKASTYFISRNHFDGQCLMKDMVPGEEYALELKANYSQGDNTFIITGSGRVTFENNTVLK